MDGDSQPDLLTVVQVQEMLQVSRSFAYALLSSGELPSYRVGGKLRRVRRRDVEAWLEENKCAVQPR
jgi:excisionase family DNA binding protein